MQVPKQAAVEMQQAAAAVPASSGKAAGLDMFADELDADIFTDAPAVSQAVAPEKKALLDNYDDAEGYYNFQVLQPRWCSVSSCLQQMGVHVLVVSKAILQPTLPEALACKLFCSCTRKALAWSRAALNSLCEGMRACSRR